MRVRIAHVYGNHFVDTREMVFKRELPRQEATRSLAAWRNGASFLMFNNVCISLKLCSITLPV